MTISVVFNTEAKNAFEKWFYAFPIIIIWAAVYAGALTFVYIEGDDATTVVYHALGRNPELQLPYSPYHGMMDIFLRLFPADESIVRHAAMTISAISAVLFFVLLLRLIAEWLPEKINDGQIFWIGFFLLLGSPEIFYFGLVYTPSITAMCFALAAHLLIRNGCKSLLQSTAIDARSATFFLLSAALFGIGIACRWDIGVYLLVIITDLFWGVGLGAPPQSLKKNLAFTLLWAITAGAAVIAAIYFSGYGAEEIFTTLVLANREVTDTKSWFSIFGAFQTLITPAFLIFFAVGLRLFVRGDWRLAVLSLIGMLPVVAYLFSREPKMILPALPGLFLAAAAGAGRLWFGNRESKYLRLKRVLIVCALAIPWFAGVRVYSDETVWGPGFEIRDAKSSAGAQDSAGVVSSRIAERNVSIKNLKPALTAGFAVPTAEGSRPLGGHAFVLFGGAWRNLMNKLDDERRQTLARAVAEKLTVVHDGGNFLFVAKLLENGFQTTDSERIFESNEINERVFFNRLGETVKTQTLRRTNSFFEPRIVSELIKTNPGDGRVILFSGNSSTFVRLNKTAPESFEPTGAFSAILDLRKLRADYARK